MNVVTSANARTALARWLPMWGTDRRTMYDGPHSRTTQGRPTDDVDEDRCQRDEASRIVGIGLPILIDDVYDGLLIRRSR